jgi:hypothetical protein
MIDTRAYAVDEAHVERAGLIEGRLNIGGRDGVKHHPPHRDFGLENLQQVPRWPRLRGRDQWRMTIRAVESRAKL